MIAPELRKIAAARRRRDKANADLREAITAARAARVPLSSIADVLGVTKQRVHQIERGL